FVAQGTIGPQPHGHAATLNPDWLEHDHAVMPFLERSDSRCAKPRWQANTLFAMTCVKGAACRLSICATFCRMTCRPLSRLVNHTPQNPFCPPRKHACPLQSPLHHPHSADRHRSRATPRDSRDLP